MAAQESEPVIEFVCHGDDYADVPKPLPAANVLPEWYRQLDAAFGDGKSTVKRCRPFFDALTRGWIIPLPTDIDVTADEDGDLEFGYDYEIPLVHAHADGETGPSTPYAGMPVMQWLSPWRIRVPEGYSVLFTAPMNRVEQRFRLFSGIIDCDQGLFHANSPFLWTQFPYSGTVEKGTPIAQLIPFRRDALLDDGRIRRMDEQDEADAKREMEEINENASRYREHRWQPKDGARVVYQEE